MPFVRFFVGIPPAVFFRRALARRSTRVRDSLQRAFSPSCRRASALHFTQLADDLPTLYARSQHPASAFIGTKRTFNPHSTHLPQPPAPAFKRAVMKMPRSDSRFTDALLPDAFPIKASDGPELIGGPLPQTRTVCHAPRFMRFWHYSRRMKLQPTEVCRQIRRRAL